MSLQVWNIQDTSPKAQCCLFKKVPPKHFDRKEEKIIVREIYLDKDIYEINKISNLFPCIMLTYYWLQGEHSQSLHKVNSISLISHKNNPIHKFHKCSSIVNYNAFTYIEEAYQVRIVLMRTTNLGYATIYRWSILKLNKTNLSLSHLCTIVWSRFVVVLSENNSLLKCPPPPLSTYI